MSKNYFGAMLDMSRNGVMKPEEVKKYALLLKKMGYNMLQLYMEDVLPYIDLESLGNDLIEDRNAKLTDYGVLIKTDEILEEENEDEMEE